MAVIPILSIKGTDARLFASRAARGDEDAQRELTELFTGEGWDIDEFECFLCGTVQSVPPIPATMLLPDPSHPGDHLAVGTCIECWALPQLTKFGMARKILRAWKPGFRLNLQPPRQLR